MLPLPLARLARCLWRSALVVAALLASPALAQGALPLSGEHALQRDHRYASPSGAHYLVFQGDGNLVVYTASGSYVWGLNETSADFGRAGRVIMQTDGNLAVYAADGSYLWSALTANPDPRAQLTLSDRGELQLAVPNGAVRWSSPARQAAAASSGSPARASTSASTGVSTSASTGASTDASTDAPTDTSTRRAGRGTAAGNRRAADGSQRYLTTDLVYKAGEYPARPLVDLGDILELPDGRVLISESIDGRVSVIGPDGERSDFVAGLDQPGALAVLADGRVLVAESAPYDMPWYHMENGELVPGSMASRGVRISVISDRDGNPTPSQEYMPAGGHGVGSIVQLDDGRVVVALTGTFNISASDGSVLDELPADPRDRDVRRGSRLRIISDRSGHPVPAADFSEAWFPLASQLLKLQDGRLVVYGYDEGAQMGAAPGGSVLVASDASGAPVPPTAVADGLGAIVGLAELDDGRLVLADNDEEGLGRLTLIAGPGGSAVPPTVLTDQHATIFRLGHLSADGLVVGLCHAISRISAESSMN